MNSRKKTAGRCPHCGLLEPVWTKAAIVDAIRRWTDEHGEAPHSRGWKSRVPGYPTSGTVRERFGSFAAALEAAGVEPRRRVNASGEWTREEVVEAIYRWAFLHGEIPQARDWVTSVDGFPTESWVRKLFGTWNAAIVAAGYEPRFPRRSKKGYRAVMAQVTRREGVAA